MGQRRKKCKKREITHEPWIIYRQGLPQLERAIRIKCGKGNNHPWINPHRQVVEVIGDSLISRSFCIINFADGLLDGGHLVVIDKRFWYQRPRKVEHTRSFLLRSPAYYLFGRAWSTGQWKRLVSSLNQCSVLVDTPQKRLKILNDTGLHYFQRPEKRKIYPIIL